MNGLQSERRSKKNFRFNFRNDFIEDERIGFECLLFNLNRLLGEDLCHADCIAAQVVNEDVVLFALMANVSVLIIGASEDVEMALTLENVIILFALDTQFAVIRVFLTTSYLDSVN